MVAKLAKSFHVDNKGIFPYDFVTSGNLNYIGDIPDIKYFNVTSNEYSDYLDSFDTYAAHSTWSLRNETIKYCELDCKVLYQVVTKFNE